MQAILLSIAETYVRYVMVGLSVWLVQHHVATASQGDQLTSEIVNHVALIAPAVAACVWGALRNIWNRRATLTALMPGIHTENDLRARLKTGSTPTITTPPNTIPGVPK